MLKTDFSAQAQNDGIVGRQIAFFAACILPVYKLVEVPSILAGFLQGDLLLPALLQFLVQAGSIVALLYAASRSDKPLFLRLEEKLGKRAAIFYVVYALFFLFSAVLPLFDLERFVYAVFFDTAPTLFAFAFFFLLSAFICTKGVKSMGRSADLSAFLFLLPFFALLFLSVGEAEFSNLLPFFEKQFGHTMYAFKYTAPHFPDALFLLPLIGNLRYKKGDGIKISLGYVFGALCVVLFLAVFYGVYSTIAPREHYAFSKIAQYFPALAVIGRVDLLLVYLLCIVLFFYVCAPLQYSVYLLSRSFSVTRRTWISAIVNIGAFALILFCNPYYNKIYALFCENLAPLFWVFQSLLFLFLFLPKEKDSPSSLPLSPSVSPPSPISGTSKNPERSERKKGGEKA